MTGHLYGRLTKFNVKYHLYVHVFIVFIFFFFNLCLHEMQVMLKEAKKDVKRANEGKRGGWDRMRRRLVVLGRIENDVGMEKVSWILLIACVDMFKFYI